MKVTPPGSYHSSKHSNESIAVNSHSIILLQVYFDFVDGSGIECSKNLQNHQSSNFHFIDSAVAIDTEPIATDSDELVIENNYFAVLGNCFGCCVIQVVWNPFCCSVLRLQDQLQQSMANYSTMYLDQMCYQATTNWLYHRNFLLLIVFSNYFVYFNKHLFVNVPFVTYQENYQFS